MMNKHFIIYRTTNCLNKRFYIGKHATENLDDGYLGSGRRIKAEIKKYGRENFERVVLEEVASREALVLREAQIVTADLRQDPLCLNLKNGGHGGQSSKVANEVWSKPERRAKQSAMLKARWEQEWFQQASAKASSDRMKKRHAAGKVNCATFTGRKHSEATKQKMREARLKRINEI